MAQDVKVIMPPLDLWSVKQSKLVKTMGIDRYRHFRQTLETNAP